MKKIDYEIIPATTAEGLAESRNSAIAQCKAKYIIFAAPGVEFDPKMGDILMEEMERSGAGMVTCGYNIIDEGQVCYETPEFCRRFLDGEDMLCRLFYQTHYQGFVWNKMFRTDVIKKRRIRFDTDINGSEEMPFLVKYLCSVHDAVMLPNILCHQNELPEADFDLELEAYYRMSKKLRRHPDPQWLCEQNIELMEMELDDY